MRAGYIIEIETPNRILLHGLWLGSKRPTRIIAWVHGLAGTMFGKLAIANALVDPDTAVLAFNNRGHDTISRLVRANGRVSRPELAGGGAEKFTDCVDDVQGVVRFAKRAGVNKVYLAGYSTGAQKCVYWANKAKGGCAVNGVILLGPISDYSTLGKLYSKHHVIEATKLAKKLVKRKRPNEILPDSIWSPPISSQRFLSLYSGKSAEEIFTYWNSQSNPKALKSVRVPILVLIAERDEFADRGANEISAWFDQNISSPHRVVIVPKVRHDFEGGERIVAREIKKFMTE